VQNGKRRRKSYGKVRFAHHVRSLPSLLILSEKRICTCLLYRARSKYSTDFDEIFLKDGKKQKMICG
jgi:hypothetical protein